MKGKFASRMRQLRCRTFIFLIAVSLMPPFSASVLCVAPGGHFAIENFYAGCCASSVIPVQMDHHDDGLKGISDCRDCTDLLLSLNECSPVQESYNTAIHGSIAGECYGNQHLKIPNPRLFLQDAFSATDASTPSSAVPLRC
jgi:hypothetical protein